MSNLAGKHDHWSLYAERWSALKPPLRPSPADHVLLERLLDDWRGWRGKRPRDVLRVLILGVTPELATFDWPTGTVLLAADNCPAMIEKVWPKEGLPRGARALLADWRSMPVESHSVDLVLGDGCLTLLDYPAGYEALMRETRRVLAAQGRWLLRVFVRPEHPETVAAVEEDLAAGSVGSFDSVKWRLATALQESLQQGVALSDVLETWRAVSSRVGKLPSSFGWDRESVAAIEAYEGSPVRYTFPSLSEVREMVRGSYREIACSTPPYELGDRFPTIMLETLP